MSAKASLTAIWLGMFIASLLVVEAYMWRRDPLGVPFLLPEDRLPVVTPIASMYAVYLAGVLGAWFLKPWKPLPFDQAEGARYVIALVCTVLWNVIVIYLIAQQHMAVSPVGRVIDDVKLATQLGGSLAILVWPVNVYYFGAKAPGAGE